mmetsp:Transcript_35377/g.93004  ORF Transcript_35377/g.93004 Transcript_35377/m.93004 type:complete len:144 (-) Transcript_35377:43-474(-)
MDVEEHTTARPKYGSMDGQVPKSPQDLQDMQEYFEKISMEHEQNIGKVRKMGESYKRRELRLKDEIEGLKAQLNATENNTRKWTLRSTQRPDRNMEVWMGRFLNHPRTFKICRNILKRFRWNMNKTLAKSERWANPTSAGSYG